MIKQLIGNSPPISILTAKVVKKLKREKSTSKKLAHTHKKEQLRQQNRRLLQ